MLADWGADVNFLIYANMCKDQFYNCKWIFDYCNSAYFWRLPDVYGDIGNYQKFSPAGLGCRLENLDVRWYWSRNDYALPRYSANTELNVYATDGAGGLPGTLLFQKILTPADYGITVPTPTASSYYWASYSGDGFTFDQDVWIGFTSLAATVEEGICTLSDDGTCGSYRSCETWDGGSGYMLDDWGVDVNFLFEAYVCCIPLPERVCSPGDQWPTLAHDFARSNASVSSLGDDAQGNLTKAWTYVQPTGLPSNLNSPVIFGDKVVCYFLDYLACIDLNTGVEIWNKPHDGFHIGSGCYSTPTVYDVAGYGPMVFTAGGDAKAFTAFDLNTGAIIWTKNFMFHSQHFMTYGPSVIVDCGGTEVIVYSDDNGSIYALEALTGVKYAGWVVNPISLGGAILKGISTDGSVIYVGIDANISNGDIFAVDACTGTTIWQFANQQLCNLNPENCGPEAFTGTVAYDVFEGAPTLFTASSYNQYVDYPPYMSGGIFYSIDAGTGALNWAATCNAQDYNGPAIDAGHVINTGWNGWISSGEYRGPVAFSKTSGSVKWSWTTANPGTAPQWLADGILSCETEKPDWYVVGNNFDFLTFYNSDNGQDMFHRRMARGSLYMHHYSPSMDDGHFLVGYIQKLFCLTEQEPRPRLDLPMYKIYTPVEFGSPDNHTVVFPNAIGNTGGAPLTIDSVILSDTDNNTSPDVASINVVNPERVERIAEKYGSSADLFKALLSDDMAAVPEVNKTSVRSNSAFAYPSWIYGLTAPTPGTVVPPQAVYNDSSNYIDIDILIDGTQVPRGLTPLFARVYSDDPDYFIDSARIDGGAYAVPQILLGIVGGCLYDDVDFTFGVGAANGGLVFNSTKLLDADLGAFEIDGDGASFFQGALFFAGPQVGTRPPGKSAIFSSRAAMHAANWHSDPNNWESILPDQNCYDQTCPPNHRTNVLLGTISNDMGASYEDVLGEIVAFAFVDSVQDMCDYDTLGNCLSWDWSYARNNGVQPPLRDTLTMGFHACGTVFGAYDQPLLNNFAIYKYDFSGRYAPNNQVYVGAMMDFDIGTDVAGYSEELSLAFDYDCGNPTGGWGMVKIPFGCGYEPMRGAKGIESQQATWNDSDIFLDSLYYWLSSVTGLTFQTGAAPCLPPIDDRDVFFNIAHLDMPQQGSGVYSIAVALFGLPDLVDSDLPENYADLAHTANKWCGFGRGDVNNDNVVNLVDIAYMIDYVYYSGNGPYPFLHLGDVNNDTVVDGADVTFLVNYYFNFGPCIMGDWTLSGY
jgi:outer membrane protein assembly factor BamB